MSDGSPGTPPGSASTDPGEPTAPAPSRPAAEFVASPFQDMGPFREVGDFGRRVPSWRGADEHADDVDPATPDRPAPSTAHDSAAPSAASTTDDPARPPRPTSEIVGHSSVTAPNHRSTPRDLNATIGAASDTGGTNGTPTTAAGGHSSSLEPAPFAASPATTSAVAVSSGRRAATATAATALTRRVGNHRDRWLRDRRRRAGAVVGGPVRRRRGLLLIALLAILALVIGIGTYLRWQPGRSPSSTPVAEPSRPVVGVGPSPLPPVTTPADSPSPSASPTPSISPTASPTRAPTPKAHPAPVHHRSTPTRKPTPTRRPKPSPTPPAYVPRTGTGAFRGLAGKCLDVANAQSADGTPIQLFTCNNTGAQRWTSQSDSTLRAYGKCLTQAGTAIQLSTCTGSGTQDWQFGSGFLVNAQSRLCAAVPGDDSDDRTLLVMAGCAPDPGQIWLPQF